VSARPGVERRRARGWALLIAAAVAWPGAVIAAQEEPPLPPGLGGGEATAGAEEPSLPAGLGAAEPAAETATEPEDSPTAKGRALPIHGFWEVRAGPRLQGDPVQPKDFTVAETRLQLEWERAWKRVSLGVRGDLVADAVSEEVEADPREVQLSASLGSHVDLKIGRQILTWGTGDLLFINDLFPKDWPAFFIGRDTEYLKAPSDAVRLGWFPGGVQVDLVYTPQFDPDRFIRGERISFWSPQSGRLVGHDRQVEATVPDRWFEDDELAIRVYRDVRSYELALYGYEGFWKSPSGFDPATSRATFPRLRVYGASVRGPAGPGIGSVEVGLLDSRDDPTGGDPLVANGEARLLVGYELELARELTGGFQYYAERLLDYRDYRDSLGPTPGGGAPRDELRHVVTVRLTRLLMSQNLRVGVFAYLSPSDRDAYLRPDVSYAWNDRWTVAAGGNWFLGENPHTFFGQFENNSNVYASVRASF
jgi:hypothetical protein